MTPARKLKDAGAPAWIVTFADLMSLLLTFFVLLLSFSKIEIDQFKKIAGAMSNAFGLQSADALSGIIELKGSPAASAHRHVVPIPIPEEDVSKEKISDEEAPAPPPVQTVEDKDLEASKRTFNDLQTVLADEIASDVMDLIRAGNVTIVRFPDKVSFPSGSGELKPEFLPVLEKFLSVLEHQDGHIVVSGHTDDVPISTGQHRSNWDLSTSRAASVVHYILNNTTIAPNRITVQGYAESRPLVPNDSEENRAKNRRVEITIQSRSDEQTAAPNKAD
ncbi:MAG: OmpA family protein [Alphaproteobacteria bacterium]|nr:OmpA family protein [Alphaproteobacteria bacterium]